MNKLECLQDIVICLDSQFIEDFVMYNRIVYYYKGREFFSSDVYDFKTLSEARSGFGDVVSDYLLTAKPELNRDLFTASLFCDDVLVCTYVLGWFMRVL